MRATVSALALTFKEFLHDNNARIERKANDATHADGERGINPPGAKSAQALRPVLREVMQGADVLYPKMAADDKHRRRARYRQRFQQFRRKPQQRPPRHLQQAVLPRRPVETEVVHFHNQRDHAVHRGGENQRDGNQAEDLGPKRLTDKTRQRDDDDFQREDEVGADGGADFFLFDLRRIAVISGFSRVFLAVRRQAVQDFFDAFVAQVGAANHQH